MKRKLPANLLLVATLIVSSFIFYGCQNKTGNPISANPNVIVILADDQGYGDLSCQGSPTIKTPNIDNLALEGMRMTCFYSAGTVCAPSRRGLMTGRFAARINAEGHEIQGGMSGEEITLAELFKSKDYATACLGKWHLGMGKGSHPNEQGFDYFYGTSSSNDHFAQNGFKYTYEGFKNATNDHFNLPLYQQYDTIEIPANQQLFTQRYTEEAIDWIEKHDDKPFFLYLAYNMPHVPLFPSKEFKGKSYAGLFGDVVEEIDWSVGEIRNALEANGLEKNTIIVYSSDNGPWRIYHELGGSQGPFRNGKGTSWEGAFRVPGIFWWPEHIDPAIVHEPVSSLDLFATFSALLGESLPQDREYDSENLLPMLLEGKKSSRNTFYYFSERANELWAVRKGTYKLHRKTVNVHRGKSVIENPPLLFNLANDPAETHNIADSNPEIVKELSLQFDAMNRHLESQ
jgi:arylsulfatase A